MDANIPVQFAQGKEKTFQNRGRFLYPKRAFLADYRAVSFKITQAFGKSLLVSFRSLFLKSPFSCFRLNRPQIPDETEIHLEPYPIDINRIVKLIPQLIQGLRQDCMSADRLMKRG
jgi:hypothetical protein